MVDFGVRANSDLVIGVTWTGFVPKNVQFPSKSMWNCIVQKHEEKYLKSPMKYFREKKNPVFNEMKYVNLKSLSNIFIRPCSHGTMEWICNISWKKNIWIKKQDWWCGLNP